MSRKAKDIIYLKSQVISSGTFLSLTTVEEVRELCRMKRRKSGTLECNPYEPGTVLWRVYQDELDRELAEHRAENEN